MDIEIKSVWYVSWSDLIQALNPEWVDQAEEVIGAAVTWGDAHCTMVRVSDLFAYLDLHEATSKSAVALRDRLESIGKYTLIDMES